MKKTFLGLALALQALAANAQDINLPSPDVKEQSLSVVEALKTRHSVRQFADKQLTRQQLSNLCWAACGISWDDNHITAPTAMNRQEIRLYVFTSEAVYLYNPKANTLERKADGDHRGLVASRQTSVAEAPVSLLMVGDYAKFGGNAQRDGQATAIDAGIVSQNINLYCQAVGLATVTRGTMDRQGLIKLLGLTDQQEPMLNNPVGYAK